MGTTLIQVADGAAAAAGLPGSGGGTGAVSAASAIGTNALQQLGGNFQQFLTLLMAQLQNQDPTSPVDTNQFTSELVQFTGVQQEVATNSNLTQLISLTQQGQVLQSAQLVGKSADVTASAISLQSSSGTIQFNSPAAQTVAVSIVDGNGNVVVDGTINAQAGNNIWVWNGQNNAGATVPDGAYRIAVEGGTASAPQALNFGVIGTVTGLSQGSNGMVLQLGQLSVPMSAVLSIGD